MILFPAIDILDQKCVRLTQGDYRQKTTYNDDPASVAIEFEQQGAEYIHIVDLNAAKSGSIENLETIKKIVDSISIPVQVGGGIRNMQAAEQYFAIGVERVIVGTAAVSDRIFLEELCEKFPNRVCLSLDVRDDEILIKGWTKGSNIRIYDYLPSVDDLPIAAIVATDISKDGMMSGPSYDLYDRMAQITKHNIIASGGVSDKADIEKLIKQNLYGAIIGKALYEGKINLKEVL